MKPVKLNTLLAITDHLRGQWNKMVEDYRKFFHDKQGHFLGEKKTYEPLPGQPDDPAMHGNTLVVTTVDEKLEYFESTGAEYIDALFSQEATNAAGNVKAELIVEGKSMGTYSALELLRLRSLLKSDHFKAMYAQIPVRSDSIKWEASKADEYNSRKIFETVEMSGTKRTSIKEDYILTDPNLVGVDISKMKYEPRVSQKTTLIDLGKYSSQKFSGEWSHHQRANVLFRYDNLIKGVEAALKIANEAEAVKSEMTAKKLFGYLHHNEIK